MTSTKYNPQLGDLVLYTANDIEQPIVGMVIRIYEEDIEDYGQETLYRIEWYDNDGDGMPDYGYSFVQTEKYRRNYVSYREAHGLQ